MKNLFLFVSVFVLAIGCTKNDSEENDGFDLSCLEFVQLDMDAYANCNGTFFNLDTIILNGDCLEATITASGCDGLSWNLDLIDSEVVSFSNPVQRNAKFCLANSEVCAAVFTRIFSFDLQPIRDLSGNEVLLNIENWSKPVVYEY